MRPSVHRSPHRFLPHAPAAERVAQTSDGTLRADLWRLPAIAGPGRYEWALLLAIPGRDVVAVQGRSTGSAWNLHDVLSPLHAEHLFTDTGAYNDTYGQRLYDDAWTAAHGIYEALRDRDRFWHGRPGGGRAEPDLLAWASVGVETWTDVSAWIRVLGRDGGPTAAQAWTRVGFSPEQASEWMPLMANPGMDPASAAVFLDANMPPAAAAEWTTVPAEYRGTVLGAADCVRLHGLGWTRDEATWARHVVRADSRGDGLFTWLSKSGMPKGRILGYLGAGIPLTEAKQQERTNPPSQQALAALAALRGHPLVAANGVDAGAASATG